jgi:hypothetical protein
MISEEKKNIPPKYFRKSDSTNVTNTLLFYLPTRHIKALKISLILLCLLIPILIFGLLRDIKWFLPLLIIIITFLLIILILYIIGPKLSLLLLLPPYPI